MITLVSLVSLWAMGCNSGELATTTDADPVTSASDAATTGDTQADATIGAACFSDEDPYRAPPDCPCLNLPGTAEELAMTPRPARDAEILALGTAAGVVAPQSSYEIIAADLVAIRALDPTLEDVHPACDVTYRVEPGEAPVVVNG